MNWQERVLNWYDENKRSLPWRKTKDPYKVWISEIILQQTKVAYHEYQEKAHQYNQSEFFLLL